ncbi:MAG: hypothetical protein GY743_20700 [Planctomycetaceae bacterium]|nr:hypothetical protein [Planctomycetaceae bacterium]
MDIISIGKHALKGVFGLLIINFLLPGGLVGQATKLFESRPPFVEGRGLTDSQIQNIKNHDRIRGLGVVKHFNEINGNRHFKISYYVPLDILVDKNGNQFAQDKLFVMLKSFGTQEAEFECKMLLQSLANACEVKEATARIEAFGKDKKRFVKVWMKLFFVQKTDFGVLPEGIAMVFKELNNTIYDDRKNRIEASDTENMAAWRLNIYNLIADACNELKSLRTNCAISRAQLTSKIHMRKNQGYLSIKGTAKFAFLE